MTMIEAGVNPEALAVSRPLITMGATWRVKYQAVVKELRRENATLQAQRKG